MNLFHMVPDVSSCCSADSISRAKQILTLMHGRARGAYGHSHLLLPHILIQIQEIGLFWTPTATLSTISLFPLKFSVRMNTRAYALLGDVHLLALYHRNWSSRSNTTELDFSCDHCKEVNYILGICSCITILDWSYSFFGNLITPRAVIVFESQKHTECVDSFDVLSVQEQSNHQ